MPIPLPPGYVARAPTADDAAAIAALITACQAAHGDDDLVTAGEVVGDWDGVDLANDALLVTTAAGAPSAYADIDNRGDTLVTVYGYVLPAHAARGLGGVLIAWGEAWAAARLDRVPAGARLDRVPAGARVAVRHYLPVGNADARQLLAARGYAAVRTVYKMAIALAAPPAPPVPPAGVTLRGFVPGRDERATYDLLEDAFRDHWSRAAHDYAFWLETTRSARAAPDLWQLAEDAASGELIGACLGQAPGGNGWITGVGVRNDCRRRGVASALLARAFGAFYARGARGWPQRGLGEQHRRAARLQPRRHARDAQLRRV